MNAAASYLLRNSGADLGGLETVHDNPLWSLSRPRLSIIAPVWTYDASPLLRALARCKRALETEIILYDDGSRDDSALAAMQKAADNTLASVRVVASWTHHGRAAAGNRAAAHARSPWLLLLDSNMAPDDETFLAAYMTAIAATDAPCVIVGGYSLAQTPGEPRYALHRWQSEQSDCLTAAERAGTPAAHVHCSNVLIHRDVLAACPFDESFADWTGDDADWSLRVGRAWPVRHIDNTVSRLGFAADEALMNLYGNSDANFALLAQRHAAQVSDFPLHRAARVARHMPFRPALKSMTGAVVRSRALPVGLRGRALKFWRALGQSEAL